MPARSDGLKGKLSRRREVTIRVIGRTSGRTISIPVWFVLDGETIYLLPSRGSGTEWYKNLLKNPSLGIGAGGAEAEFDAVAITKPAEVSAVVEKFRGKYGDDGIKLYAKLDVAVRALAR